MAKGPKNNQLAEKLRAILKNSGSENSVKSSDQLKHTFADNVVDVASKNQEIKLPVNVPFFVKGKGKPYEKWAVPIEQEAGVRFYFFRKNHFVFDCLERKELTLRLGRVELMLNGFEREIIKNGQRKLLLFLNENRLTHEFSSGDKWKKFPVNKNRTASLQPENLPVKPRIVAKTVSGGQSRILAEKFKVTSIEEFSERGFAWAKPIQKQPELRFDFGKGRFSQLAESGQVSVTEIVMGIDFGTSSTKVAIRDSDQQITYPVFFPQTSESVSQIIPSIAYLENGSLQLMQEGLPVGGIKVNALKSNVSDSVLAISVAYLALIIRFSRGYLWRNYASRFSGRDLLWRFHFGIPAAEVRSFPVRERYLAICRAAVLLSSDEREAISLLSAEKMLSLCLSDSNADSAFFCAPDSIRTAFNNSAEFFLLEGVKIWPEIMAQTYGFLRSNLWNPESMRRILTIDVGAGTFDVALCEINYSNDDDRNIIFSPLATFVDGLGIRNLVHHRAHRVLDFCHDDEFKVKIENHSKNIEDTDWSKTYVPTELFGSDGFFPGMQTVGDSKILDQIFKEQIAKMIWSSTVLKVFTKPSGSGPESLPVFLCGGGKEIKFYRNLVFFYSNNSANRVVFSLQNVRSSDDFIDSDPDAFDRLSVAYGLAFLDLGSFVDDGYGLPSQGASVDLDLLRPHWADQFIDKDMI
jgi:hypothetical protein